MPTVAPPSARSVEYPRKRAVWWCGSKPLDPPWDSGAVDAYKGCMSAAESGV
jgi:hypothetical protein